VGGLLVRCAHHHDGAARVLVHNLKYQGLVSAAAVLAAAMSAALPSDTGALVPVPRVLARRWRYGIDPAEALAVALSASSGVPIAACLSRPWWWARRAGPAGGRRGEPRFTVRAPAPAGSVLIDDVFTTGATLAAAATALGRVSLAVTATGPAVGTRHR
jgi:predicted amidophosphoribosyltransferase